MSKYDLEERSLQFACDIRALCKSLRKHPVEESDIKQVIRSSGSIGANYIEANECLGKKDFLHRLRISRKEAKETYFWLRLILQQSPDECKNLIKNLINETSELRAILSAIINKVS